MNSKEKTALSLNVLLVVMEIVAFYLSFRKGFHPFYQYYTELSNMLTLFASVLFAVCMLLKKSQKDIPSFVIYLRFVSAISLLFTFLVVVFVLAPSYNFDFYWLLIFEQNLFMHLLCPIVSFISFIYFEGDRRYNRKKVISYVFVPTLVYALIMLAMNYMKIVDGPYPFFRVETMPVYMTVLWIAILAAALYFISKLSLYANQRNSRIRRMKKHQ